MSDTNNNNTIINKSRVRLELHATNLKNLHGAFSTSSPFAVVTVLANDPRESPQILGQTEVIKHSLSPKWTTYFDMDFELGKLTRINVGVFDSVNNNNNKGGVNKPMGSALFEVGEILASPGNTKAKKLRDGGTLYVRVTSARERSAGRLLLTMRGVGLKNVEGLFGGLSDPFFEISIQVADAGNVNWHPVYRSKHVDNNLNPVWDTCDIELDRLGASERLDLPILISVWDWQKNGKHQFMGSFETSVQALLDKQMNQQTSQSDLTVDLNKSFALKLKGRSAGHVVVTSAKVDRGPQFLATTGFAAQNYPPIRISEGSTVNNPSSSNSAYQPTPEEASYSQPSSFAAAATAVSAAAAISGLSLSNTSANSAYNNDEDDIALPAGPLPPPLPPPIMAAAKSAPRPSFVQYIMGGCELELAVAIDFTGSNGDPRIPGTLHYIHADGQLNDYEKAITAVGSIVGRYDHDQQFPVYGFGAKYNGVVQHCFQVGNAPFLSGMSGVLEGYRNVFRTGLTMSGPTVFAEVIDLVASLAKSKQETGQRFGKQSYTILLILTDGAVTDVELTKRAIRAACDAPLSIVIVGIGTADFTTMNFLDDFGQQEGPDVRDICNFVEFSKYKNDKAALTQRTLAEIPDQLVDYFYSRGIMPLPPASGSQVSLQASEHGEDDIDLNIQVNGEGKISLANNPGAMHDDTKYDTIDAYNVKPTSPYAPPPSQAPYQPQAPHNPNAPPSYNAPPYGAAPAAPRQPNLFHVQLPPGVSPGMQVQVKNPVTGQNLIVVVPQGVPPGGKFAVQY